MQLKMKLCWIKLLNYHKNFLYLHRTENVQESWNFMEEKKISAWRLELSVVSAWFKNGWKFECGFELHEKLCKVQLMVEVEQCILVWFNNLWIVWGIFNSDLWSLVPIHTRINFLKPFCKRFHQTKLIPIQYHEIQQKTLIKHSICYLRCTSKLIEEFLCIFSSLFSKQSVIRWTADVFLWCMKYE